MPTTAPDIRPLAAGVAWLALMLAAFAWFIGVDWTVPDECLSADGTLDTCYCEALGDGRIRQPVNTWSSLIFAVVGLLIMAVPALGRRAPPTPLGQDRLLTTLFGGLAIYLGVGSMAFHATQSDVGGFIDSTGMYLLPSMFLLVQVARLRGWSTKSAAAVWFALNLSLFAVAAIWRTVATELFTALIQPSGLRLTASIQNGGASRRTGPRSPEARARRPWREAAGVSLWGHLSRVS